MCRRGRRVIRSRAVRRSCGLLRFGVEGRQAREHVARALGRAEPAAPGLDGVGGRPLRGQIPADMLARVAQAVTGPSCSAWPRHAPRRSRPARRGRRARIAAVASACGDAAGHPRRAVGAAPDHDGIGAGRRQRGSRACRVDDVAVDDDGNAHGFLDARARRLQSASPLKNWQRVRACTVTSCTPAASARRASSGALRLAWSQPSRILSVTGTLHGADHRLDQRDARDPGRASARSRTACPSPRAPGSPC